MADDFTSELVADITMQMFKNVQSTTDRLIAAGDEYRTRYAQLVDSILDYADSLDSRHIRFELHRIVNAVADMTQEELRDHDHS